MTAITLPNVRKLFIPDPGYTMFDADLKGADAQVVAWEAEDEDLKAAFRAGVDVHSKNAEDMLGATFTQLSGHARDAKRQETKKGVHATNYGGAARTLAITLGWTVHDADRFQRRWFALHPGIKNNFHNRIQADLHRNRTITNAFGFRRVYFDRPDACFTEALAWKPQSVVALNSFIGALQLEEKFPSVQILLQDHDSLVFQFPTSQIPPAAMILSALTAVTPYPDPLRIPWELKSSTKSWGDCRKVG
jgi:DNA polymerase-1